MSTVHLSLLILLSYLGTRSPIYVLHYYGSGKKRKKKKLSRQKWRHNSDIILVSRLKKRIILKQKILSRSHHCILSKVCADVKGWNLHSDHFQGCKYVSSELLNSPQCCAHTYKADGSFMCSLKSRLASEGLKKRPWYWEQNSGDRFNKTYNL